MAVGILRKMEVENLGLENLIEPKYSIRFDNELVEINQLINKKIEIRFLEKIFCIKCGRNTKKSFGQGYCYPCFISAPETEDCVLRPELCRAHEGVARDMDFAKEHCLIDHFVYLAWTGGLKVGVTRHHQIPTRWIDQGATRAIKLCRTPNRFSAGQIEVELKKIFADKTNWQAMLKGEKDNSTKLLGEKAKALEFINGKGFSYIPEADSEYSIIYPIVEFPVKVKSHSFDKELIFNGTLMGVKGQYLLLNGGKVLNIRNHGGYMVEIRTDIPNQNNQLLFH
jgi:hypothetical protein